MSRYQEGYDDQLAWLRQQPDPAYAAEIALPARLATVDSTDDYNAGGNDACRSMIPDEEG